VAEGGATSDAGVAACGEHAAWSRCTQRASLLPCGQVAQRPRRATKIADRHGLWQWRVALWTIGPVTTGKPTECKAMKGARERCMATHHNRNRTCYNSGIRERVVRDTVKELEKWLQGNGDANKIQVVCDVASTAAGVAGGIAGSTVGAAQGQSIGSWLGEQVGWESAGSAAGLVIGGILGGLAGHTTANSVATYALNSFFSLGPKHALHDCYELLEVSRESTVQELTKAYRRKSIMHHPDKPQGSHQMMTKLNLCREILVLSVKNDPMHRHDDL